MSNRTFSAEDAERVFDDCFASRHHVRLEGGADEPLYLPARGRTPARVIYRADYVASALHEVAHWCIAGPARRLRRDYGYWYRPAGRDDAAQRDFEAVEARPQALEQLFAEVVGVGFVPSLDNPGVDAAPLERLAAAVAQARERLLAAGLPPRALRFRQALAAARGPQ